MTGRAQDYYEHPRQNPLRLELCQFLISKGEKDYFDDVRFWSNYQLENFARSKGWVEKKRDGNQFAMPYSD